MWVICGASGRALDFELYAGKGTGYSKEHKNLGLGGSIVMRLCETVPKNVNHKIIFDNYFTSIKLIRLLQKDGIHSLGVVKKNSMMGCPLTHGKELMEKGRGAFDCKISKERDVACVRWADNGIVNLASSFAATAPVDSVKRWSQSTKKHIQITRPHVVQIYNEFMGGVDKMDMLIALYKIKCRTKKWSVRAIMHFVDFALSNAWLEYKEQEIMAGNKKFMDFLSYRCEVAHVLIKASFAAHPQVGRPRSLDTSNQKMLNLPPKNKRQLMPTVDARYDRVDHMPEPIDGNPRFCVVSGCQSRTRVRCLKCEVFLCLTKDRNCFKKFHYK